MRKQVAREIRVESCISRGKGSLSGRVETCQIASLDEGGRCLSLMLDSRSLTTLAKVAAFCSFVSARVLCASSTWRARWAMLGVGKGTDGRIWERMAGRFSSQTALVGLISIKKSRPRSSSERWLRGQAWAMWRTPALWAAKRDAMPARVPINVESIPVHASRSITRQLSPAAILESPYSLRVGLLRKEPFPSQRIQLNPSKIPIKIGHSVVTKKKAGV